MYYTYVLHSVSFGKIYVGQTSNLEQRLNTHNSLENNGWTSRFRPWTLVHVEEFEVRSLAMKREKELKTARGRKFIWEMITPET